MNIGKAMQTIREECGLSRQEMAQKLGCTATAVWKQENGRARPKQATIDKFCTVTATPLAYLYNRAFEAKDFRMNPNGLMLDGTPVYQDGMGRVFPV